MSTGTEVAIRPQASLPAKIAYANELANSGLLPAQYRRQPANVLYALEYGEMLGLSPMAAITGVHVIEGKPSASAGLISALVRRAGHKLRVTGNGLSATCTIVRADDPDYTFSVTWTLRRNGDGNPSAEEAGLLGKQVWKQYGAAMLKARAITQCSRDACEEALFGLHYTPEELGVPVDEEGNIVAGEVIADDEPQTAPAVQEARVIVTDEEWLGTAIADAATFPDEESGRKLWRESAAKSRAGECTIEDAKRVQELIKARLADLQDEAAGQVAQETTINPDHPWATKIADLASAWEAGGALAELAALDEAGHIGEDEASQARAAILARFPDAGTEAAA